MIWNVLTKYAPFHMREVRRPRRRKSPTTKPRVRLWLETLEERTTPTVVDLTTAGTSGTINGALFVQSTAGAGGAFVEIENSPTEQGYNTDFKPQFDEKNNPLSAFQLSSVAEVNNAGTLYYEFLLGINQQNSGGNELLSLDQLRIYVSPTNINTSANNFANGYNPATGTLGGLSPSYDMNPGLGTTNYVQLNEALKPGNATFDMMLFVPVSALGTNPNSWIYLYSAFGGHQFTSGGVTGGASNDGFEEWANNTLVKKPTISTTPGSNVVVGSGNALTDSATLAGGNTTHPPTGTITFQLFAPGTTTNPVFTNVVTVTGAGTFHSTDAGTTTGSAVPTMVGIYQWVVSYSGDLNNSPVSSTIGQEPASAEECRVLLDPPTETDNVGDQATFTAEVDTSTDSIHWTHVGAGVPVTFSLVNNTAGATIVTTSTGSNPANTDSTGKATVTITSANPGTVNIHAATTFTLAGVLGTFSCATGMVPSAPDAQKTFVTAPLTTPTITTSAGPTVPLDMSTALTDSATLANGSSPTGTITFLLLDPTGTTVYTNTVAVTGNATYQSNAPGTILGSAVPTRAGTYQWIVSYSGDSHNDAVSSVIGSEPQNVVDANISISPLTPVDEVNNAETFTVTVTALPAATGAPSFGPLTVNVSGGLTPTVSVAKINGNVATWTVTINSATPGAFTVQAGDQVTMGGVTVTRTTGDGLSGDSNNAVKNFVDANIGISPLTMDNLINVPETFTITVTAFPAGTGTPTFAVPIVTFPGGSGTPGTVGPVTPLTPPMPQPDGSWTATWTETINSAVTGAFHVQAADTVTMGGVAVTRTTGDGISGDSPSAIKTYVPLTPADLVLTKTVDNPTPMFGSLVTYTLTVTDKGPGDATGVVLADTLPTGEIFVSATPSQGVVTNFPPGPLRWDVGTLAVGADAVITVTVQTAAVGLLVNNAGVGLDQPDPTPADNLAQAPITVMLSPPQIGKDLFLASTILDPPAGPNGSVGSAAGSMVAPLNATLPFTDSFATLGNRPEFSPYWTDGLGTMIGINNQPFGVGDFDLATLNGVSQADAAVTAGVSLSAGETAGLVSRYRGPGYSNFYLGQLRSIGNGQFQAAIFDNIGGTFNTLTVGSTVNSGTGALEFELVGSSLKLLWNNQLVAYAQDTSITAPGSVGMRLSQGVNVSSFSANKITSPPVQAVPFTDTFRGISDGSQLTTNWSDQLGNVTVVNSTATGEGAFNLSTVNSLSIGNAKVTANINVNPGGNAGLTARYGGPGYSNFYLGQLRDLGNGRFQAAIFKNIGGVFTTITVGSTTASSGTGTLEFEVVGSSLKLIFNNKLLASGFDTSLTVAAGGSAGMRLGQGATASSFSADQIVVPTSQPLPFADSFSNSGDGYQLSTNWSDQNGNIAVAAGAAVGAWDFNLSTVNGISAADVTVAGDVNLTPGAGQSAGLVARYTGPLYSNFYLAQFRDIGNGRYQAAIFKNIGGTFSLVTLGSTTTKNAGRLQFKLKGSALEVDLDNTVLASVVDTSITGPGSVGMRLSMNAGMRNFSAS
jgi:uncharacterized repeat protein (TIGR01451 family)